jgi:hypothetical protein
MDTNDTDQTRLTELLGDLSERDAGLDPPARVQRAVMARWAERYVATPLPTDTAPPASLGQFTWTRAWLGLAGTAAAVVLVAWALNGAVEKNTPLASAGDVSPSVEIEPRSAPSEVPTRAEPVVVKEAPAVDRPSVRPRATAAHVVSADAEPFVRLLPLTNEELAGIRLARVRMRGQAAQTLGLDLRIPSPGADGFVEADVLLGEDGLARAIRFVH